MKDIGVYIHIPFCRRKCPYCDFYSVKFSEETADIYTEKLCQAIDIFGNRLKRQADTLYFGGGTPSITGADRICRIAERVKNAFHITENAEITVEVNPEKQDIDFEKMRSAGINRLSIGLQSADDGELRLLGRLHDVSQAEKCIKKAEMSGFENISLDLMIATPTQTKESLEKSIEFCAERNVRHISAYILKIEENTPYYKMRDSLEICDDDEQAEMYLYAVGKLREYGYCQYEISNFCKSGFESRHNLKYWHDEEYLGIGSSAHSFIDGKRFFFKRSFQDFYDMKTESDGEGGSIEEFVMLALRLSEGLRNDLFKQRFGINIPEDYIYNAKKFEKMGLLYADKNCIRLTPNGFLLSNYIISEILG